MEPKTVCIIGGTGFVGNYIANRLGRRGDQVRVLTRRRERKRDVLSVPRLLLVETDVHDERALMQQVSGCDVVINLAGILNEHKGPKGDAFRRVHADLPRKIVTACRRAGVKRYLHMSALGAASDAPSLYQRTKAEGERAALEADSDRLRVTAFRPSVIFGPGDSFLSLFAILLRIAPGVMLLPTPDAQFKPVYVGNVAEAFVRAIDDPAGTSGKSYELCGPRIYTLRELVEYIGRTAGLRRKIVGLPDFASRLQARILQRVPGKPYSYDNYLSSTVPNVCTDDGLAQLGITPTPLEAVAPGYIGPYHRQDRYQDFRKEAGRQA